MNKCDKIRGSSFSCSSGTNVNRYLRRYVEKENVIGLLVSSRRKFHWCLCRWDEGEAEEQVRRVVRYIWRAISKEYLLQKKRNCDRKFINITKPEILTMNFQFWAAGRSEPSFV